MSPIVLHFFAVFCAIGLAAIGSGIGQGIAGFGALSSLVRQRVGGNHIFRAMVLGLALIESGMILSLVVVLMLLFGGGSTEMTWGVGYAELGMGLAIGCAAAAVSVASSFAVKSACISIGRQPYSGQKILTLMLLIQSIIEAPVIFALLIALLIKTQITDTMSIYHGFTLLGAGLTIAIGSIGPSIGQALFAHSACSAIGLNAESQNKLLPFSLLSQAVIETPLIFSLVVAALLVYKPVSETMPFVSAIVALVVAFAVGVGTAGSAVASGYTAAKSAKSVALDPDNYTTFLRATLLGQAIIESAAIYALIVGLILVTRVF